MLCTELEFVASARMLWISYENGGTAASGSGGPGSEGARQAKARTRSRWRACQRQASPTMLLARVFSHSITDLGGRRRSKG
eukprot:6774237-Pyramimonas_sp.AAC.1